MHSKPTRSLGIASVSVMTKGRQPCALWSHVFSVNASQEFATLEHRSNNEQALSERGCNQHLPLTLLIVDVYRETETENLFQVQPGTGPTEGCCCYLRVVRSRLPNRAPSTSMN